MKIEITKTNNLMSFTVEGHRLSAKEPEVMLGVAKKILVLFSAGQVGVTADVLCNGTITRQQIFRAGGGVEGWITTSKALEKDIQDVLAELENGVLPGVSLDIVPDAEILYLDRQRVATPGKELVGASGQPLQSIPFKGK